MTGWGRIGGGGKDGERMDEKGQTEWSGERTMDTVTHTSVLKYIIV
jgi:hypothetical protein